MNDRSILVVFNPSAGKGKSARLLPKLQSFLDSRNLKFTILKTTKEFNGAALIKETHQTFSEIIVLGGDGTLNEVVNGLEKPVPIGIIPGGTGNDYAKNLDLGSSPEEIFQTSVEGQECSVDVGRCNERLFLNGVGIGFDGQVAKHAEESDIWLSGWPEYYYHVLRNLAFFGSVPLQISIDGKMQEASVFLLTIAKGKTFGGSFKLTPKASLTDGYLSICKISKISVMKRLMNIHRLQSGSHDLLPEVEFIQAKSIWVKSDEAADAHLDGEYIGNPPFSFEVLPKYIRIRARATY